MEALEAAGEWFSKLYVATHLKTFQKHTTRTGSYLEPKWRTDPKTSAHFVSRMCVLVSCGTICIVCREPSHYIIVPRPKNFGRNHNDVMMTDPFFPQLVSMARPLG